MAEPEVPRRRQRNRRGSGGELRREILDAARDIVGAGNDESAVTLRAVARRIGIAAPSIYAHFATPEEIVEALAGETFELLADTIAEDVRAYVRLTSEPSPRALLLATCRAYLGFGLRHPGLYRLLYARAAMIKQDAKLKSWCLDMPDPQGFRAFRYLLEAVTACIDGGQSRATSPFETAVKVWIALHGYVMLQVHNPLFPWPEQDRLGDEMIFALAQV